jgi:hypothetical protein
VIHDSLEEALFVVENVILSREGAKGLETKMTSIKIISEEQIIRLRTLASNRKSSRRSKHWPCVSPHTVTGVVGLKVVWQRWKSLESLEQVDISLLEDEQ